MRHWALDPVRRSSRRQRHRGRHGARMRAIAGDKLADLPNVTILEADAYDLRELPGLFTGGLAMQWLSHVPAARRDEFLAGWHSCLAPGIDPVPR